MDEVGLDQVQDALVVGDDQDAHVGAGELVDALGDGAQRVDVEAGVGLVEDRHLGPQQGQLEDLHPLLLAAGEAVVEVAAGEVLGMFASSIASSACLRKSLILISLSPRASRWALTIIRRYLLTVTPGIATGYWKAMKRPAASARRERPR